MFTPTLLATKQICRRTFVRPSNIHVDLELGAEQKYLHNTLSVNQHIIHIIISLFAACQSASNKYRSTQNGEFATTNLSQTLLVIS